MNEGAAAGFASGAYALEYAALAKYMLRVHLGVDLYISRTKLGEGSGGVVYQGMLAPEGAAHAVPVACKVFARPAGGAAERGRVIHAALKEAEAMALFTDAADALLEDLPPHAAAAVVGASARARSRHFVPLCGVRLDESALVGKPLVAIVMPLGKSLSHVLEDARTGAAIDGHALAAGAPDARWLQRGAADFGLHRLHLASMAAASVAAWHERERDEFEPVQHGDVKPANFLVMWDGSVRLSDFGEASGSRGFATPSMLLTKAPATSSKEDVFALALTVYDVLTLSSEADKRVQKHNEADGLIDAGKARTSADVAAALWAPPALRADDLGLAAGSGNVEEFLANIIVRCSASTYGGDYGNQFFSAGAVRDDLRLLSARATP